ncbi:TPA: DUF1642 domain-containing protein [Streptococcus pneumoniae]
MNKQELIERIEGLPYNEGLIVDTVKISRNGLLKLIEQLDEPQPVKVPQCVADWYEKKKHDLNHYIWDYIYNWNHQEESEFKRWMNCSIISFQTLVNMHQFGYEVEKEKRYLVKMKGIDTNFNFLNRHRNENYWIFSSKDKNTLYQTHHTRKQLEDADFGWVFDCPGVEVEEVE